MIDPQQVQYLAQEIACAIDSGIKSAVPSLRDHFAGLALQGLVSATAKYAPQGNDPTLTFPLPEALARYSYMLADAMLAERERKP